MWPSSAHRALTIDYVKVTTRQIAVNDIVRTRERISPLIRSTPVASSPSLKILCGVPVHLKLENHQITGSFKLRGATNAVMNLSDSQKKYGVVSVSTGNHGRGVAYAAKKAGVRCIICMSSLAPQIKIDGIRSYGAEVRIIGNSQDEAQLEADRLVKEEHFKMLSAFDDYDVITGQGTLGLELYEQLPQLRTVLVPVSGGGLISGVAFALKAMNSAIQVIGVSMELGAAMYHSLQAGQPVEVEETPTLADSLGGGIGLKNKYTLRLVRNYVDDFVLVTEKEIAKAVQHAYWQERQILEGGGAVGIAALLSRKLRPASPTAIIASGGNIDMALHHRIISGEFVDVAEERRK